MGVINYKVVLSVTEPNHQIFLRFRQDDTQTQTLSVEIVKDGKLFPFGGYTVEFVNITRTDSGQPIIERAENVSPNQARIEFTLNNRCLQWLGKNTAYFSFRDVDGNEVFSTNNFEYEVAHGAHKGPILDSGYLWTVEELIEKAKYYMAESKAEWEEFVNANKEFLESVDPGGAILTELIEARGDYNSINERLVAIETPPTFEVPTYVEELPIRKEKISVTNGQYTRYDLDNLDSVLADADTTKFNLGFISDTHVEAHNVYYDGIHTKDKTERRWYTIGQFRTLEAFTDAMVYGGDNVDGYSGGVREGAYACLPHERRKKTLYEAKRFGRLATAGAKVPVIICNGNHDCGNIPYATDSTGRSPETTLTRSDIHEAWNGRYSLHTFPSKQVAILRLDTNDFSDATSDGKFIEYSGTYNGSSFAEGKLSQEQLHDVATWLTELDRSYHLLIVCHVPIDGDDRVANASMFEQIIEAYRTGSRVTINYDNSAGYNPDSLGSQTYDFNADNVGIVAGILAGHVHAETSTTFAGVPVITTRAAFVTQDYWNTTADGGFANVVIDTANRNITLQGVGYWTAQRIFSY